MAELNPGVGGRVEDLVGWHGCHIGSQAPTGRDDREDKKGEGMPSAVVAGSLEAAGREITFPGDRPNQAKDTRQKSAAWAARPQSVRSSSAIRANDRAPPACPRGSYARHCRPRANAGWWPEGYNCKGSVEAGGISAAGSPAQRGGIAREALARARARALPLGPVAISKYHQNLNRVSMNSRTCPAAHPLRRPANQHQRRRRTIPGVPAQYRPVPCQLDKFRWWRWRCPPPCGGGLELGCAATAEGAAWRFENSPRSEISDRSHRMLRVRGEVR